MSFALHPRLAADSVFITDLSLSQARLVNDARYPWVLLVPRREGLRDLHALTDDDSVTFTRESRALCRVMVSLFAPAKMNVASLGNLVPQLHVHHVARFTDDPAWPGPVWGVGEPRPYAEDALAVRVGVLRGELTGSARG